MNKEKVITIVKRHLGEQQEITEETSFINDLGADSLDIVEIVMDMEEEYNIKVEDADAEKMQTVGDVIDYLNSRENHEEED